MSFLRNLSFLIDGPYRKSRSACFIPALKSHLIALSTVLLGLSMLLTACSGLDFGSAGPVAPTTAATPAPETLARLHWCGKPAMTFRDEAVPSTTTSSSGTAAGAPPLGPANGTPTTITNWSQVKANLGFTIFLPSTLPSGTCLLSVLGTLRDPIFGSNFTITYILPAHDSITLSQAPLRSQNTAFQCSIAPNTTSGGGAAKGGTPAAQSTITSQVQLCTGVRDKTNIVFSARGATATLQHFFQDLQPDIEWIPAS